MLSLVHMTELEILPQCWDNKSSLYKAHQSFFFVAFIAFYIMDLMIVKIMTTKWHLIDTFFFSSASCFDLTGFFSPAFIMPIENDFNLLCEIVCRTKQWAWFHHVKQRNSWGIVSILRQKLVTKISGTCLPSSIQGLTPLGTSPKEDFCQDLTSSPPLHLRKMSVLPRMLCSKTALRMTMSIIITKSNLY